MTALHVTLKWIAMLICMQATHQQSMSLVQVSWSDF